MNTFTIPVVSLDLFLDKNEFRNLIDSFYYQDIRLKEDVSKVEIEDVSKVEILEGQIVFKKFGMEIMERDYVEDDLIISGELVDDSKIVVLDLYKDYLFPAIDMIPGRYKTKYNKILSKAEPYTKEQEKSYVGRQKQMFIEILRLVKDREHLEKIASHIEEVIYQCINFLDTRLNPDDYQKKVRFELRRNQLIGFFFVLSKKQKIHHGSDAQLALFMQDSFLSKKGMPLEMVYKELNNFTNASQDPKASKTSKGAFQELKKIKRELKDFFLELLS